MEITREGFLKGALATLGIGAFGFGRVFAAPPGWKPKSPPNLVFGAISDSHLRTGPHGDYVGKGFSDKYFAAALKYFREKNVDAVVHTGDFAHRGQVAEMEFHARVWEKVFPDNRAPDGHEVVKLFTTGNHDLEGSTYGDFVEMRYPDKKKRAKHILCTEMAEHWKRIWKESYRPVWVKCVKGYFFFGRHYGVKEDETVKLLESFEETAKLGTGTRPVFHLQHVCPGMVVNDALKQKGWRNLVGFYGHSHGSASNWNQIRLLSDANALIQIPAVDPRGSNKLGGDAYIAKAKLEGGEPDVAGRAMQGYLVRVYDDMLVISRREFNHGGSLGSAWVLPFGKYDPHPYSMDELKKRIGSPQFPEGAKLSVSRAESGMTVKIPLANGNPDSRVYAYDVVVANRNTKKCVVRSVYASGCNMGIGHENAKGVTTLRINGKDVPEGDTLCVAVRPLSSLGTKGKAILTTIGNEA